MAGTAEIINLNGALENPAWLEKLDLIKRTVAQGASADELDLFFYTARRAGLDPLARQIHYVKRGNRGTIQVGIDGLRVIADRTGVYAGNDDAEFSGTSEQGYPSRAKVTVYKIVGGVRCAFSATARWDEYYPGDSQGFQWRKMPHVMLAKCAEALALRKAFPADLSGLYVHEEMERTMGAAPSAPTDEPEVREAAPALEGRALLEATVQAFGVKKGAKSEAAKAVKTETVPEGKTAFGYQPERWPLAKMFGEPQTESQAKMLTAKARDRMVPEEAIDGVRTAVLAAYGLDSEPSKGNASLVIDWLINATEETVDAAVEAAEHPVEA